MRKARIFLILGVWIMIIPYTGFPYSWKDILTTLSGLLLVYLSYSLYREYKAKKNKTENFDNFVENSDFDENKNNEESKIEINISESILELDDTQNNQN